ncbi:sulfurtransferase [uncultured Oxalicibacterium sp.]|uniref:sulfurtransferase n=1 Tax=uncultured Oxalicibacterium sp. TaxID=1168540 RepID=UPI0025FFE557|nr:sulfurtransferase [uncultured Oxalicibacterium sp.]
MTFSTLITAETLSQHLNDPAWIVIDCRHDLGNPDAGRDAYAQGHIPGAYFAHLDHDLAGETIAADGSFRGRHPLPDRASFIATLQRWGIDEDTQVVVYDAHGGTFAARLWWMLRWVGHKAVAVLDGGWQDWLAHELPSTTAIPTATQPDTLRDRGMLTRQVDVSEVLYNVEAQRQTLVDARAPDRYRGENETIDPVGGHIPGARNRFYKDNLNADGRFKNPEQLREEWLKLIDDPAQAIMQCGSGVTACHNLLALEIAGLYGAALYPGSWSEWCADPKRPIA